MRDEGLLHPAHPIGRVPAEVAPASSVLPVTVFTFVHEDATHMGERRLNAIECAGIYPPNREK